MPMEISPFGFDSLDSDTAQRLLKTMMTFAETEQAAQKMHAMCEGCDKDMKAAASAIAAGSTASVDPAMTADLKEVVTLIVSDTPDIARTNIANMLSEQMIACAEEPVSLHTAQTVVAYTEITHALPDDLPHSRAEVAISPRVADSIQWIAGLSDTAPDIPAYCSAALCAVANNAELPAVSNGSFDTKLYAAYEQTLPENQAPEYIRTLVTTALAVKEIDESPRTEQIYDSLMTIALAASSHYDKEVGQPPVTVDGHVLSTTMLQTMTDSSVLLSAQTIAESTAAPKMTEPSPEMNETGINQ